MKTRIARTVAEIDGLRALWDSLRAKTSSATFFQSFQWNRLAVECFSGHQSPHVVAVESDSGAAIIPACRGKNGIALLGEELFDYRDVLSSGDETTLQYGWARLAELRLPMTVTALYGERVRARWRKLQPHEFTQAPQVRVTETECERFASAHSRLGRMLRNLARQGVSLHHYGGGAAGVVRTIYQRKGIQIDAASSLFRNARRIDFMVAACAMAGPNCEIFTLERNELAAALVTFRDDNMRRFYTIYFDPTWARYSPGITLLFEVTRRSLASGLNCDYMTGAQPYKMRFMTSAVPLFRVEAAAEQLAQAAGRHVESEAPRRVA